MALYNIYYAQHGDDLVRVGHNEVLRWYMSLDGEHWTSVDDHTLRSALDDAHARLHHAGEKCKQGIEWKFRESSRSVVLGQCPKCSNPGTDSDLRTYRSCPDCGWRIDFTKEQIEWLEGKLREGR